MNFWVIGAGHGGYYAEEPASGASRFRFPIIADWKLQLASERLVEERGEELGEIGLVKHHRIGDSREPHNAPGNLPARIDEAVILFEDFSVFHLHRRQLGDTVLGRAAAGRFDIHDAESGVG